MFSVVVPTKYNSLSGNVNNFEKNYCILPAWSTFSSCRPSNEIPGNLGIDHIERDKTVIQNVKDVEKL